MVADRALEEGVAKTELHEYEYDGEAHADHRAAARLVRKALAAPRRGRRPEVWMFEVWTPLQRMDQIVDRSGDPSWSGVVSRSTVDRDSKKGPEVAA